MFQQLSSTSKRIISKQAEIVNFPDNCCEKAVNFARKENISSPRRIHAKLKVLYSVAQWGQRISEVYAPFFYWKDFLLGNIQCCPSTIWQLKTQQKPLINFSYISSLYLVYFAGMETFRGQWLLVDTFFKNGRIFVDIFKE